MLLNLGRDPLNLGVIKFCVVDDGVDECTLREFKGSITEMLDGNADIIGRMALVFDVEIKVQKLEIEVSSFFVQLHETRKPPDK